MADSPPNNELQALCQSKNRLLQQNEELLILIRTPHPPGAQPAQDDPQRGEHQHPNPLREITEEKEHSQSAGNVRRRAQTNEEDKEIQSQNRGTLRNEFPTFLQERKEQFWEQRFKEIQQKLNHMKEAVKGKTPM